jgi:hypothetical protein
MDNEVTDWQRWHEPYDDPASPLSRRLAIVQQHLRQALPVVLESPLRVISLCAGQGHDLFGVLQDYPLAHRVQARLVEFDAWNVQVARQRAEALRLHGVEVVCSDAALLAAYEGMAPANVVLACGVFGNVRDADVFRIIDLLPQLCDRGATVIWTRSRRAPDLTPMIRRSFVDHAFVEAAFVAPDDVLFSVGVHRFLGISQPLQPDQRMFTFSV